MNAKGIRRYVAVAAASLLSLAVATAAAAQGMYYKEIAKDGRIYVFNDAKRAEAFEKGGDAGAGLTRLNAGPNGETVVADSEQALDLFFFKHGIAEAVERPKAPKANISYKDGQLTAEFDKAQVTFTNRLQLRFTQQMPDETVQLPGTAAKGDSKGSFRIRRYEPQFSGWLYTKDLTYKLEFAFQDLQNNAVAGGAVNDAYFNYDLTHSKKNLRVRQELTSSFNLQFVDRSIVAGEYEKGRDLGLQLDGLLAGGKLAWAAGVFNGNGRSVTLNDNDKYQYDARVVLQPLGGDVRYSEADFESTDKPQLAIAGQFESGNFFNVTAGNDLKRQVLGGDVVFKYKRLFLFGEYFDRKLTPETGASYKSNGYNLEAGYLLDKGRHWEVAFRYAAWDPTDLKSGDDRTELGGAINWFYNKHFAKIQADFRQLEDKAKKTKDKELRIQTQLYF
jgi:hypothetical protein